MYTRLELRRARRISNPRPGRFPRSIFDHLRALLILDDRTRVALGTVRMPVTSDERVEELVSKSRQKLKKHVTDEAQLDWHLNTLRTQAQAYRETPEQREGRLARQEAPWRKLTAHLARKRAEQAAGEVPPKGERYDEVEDGE